MGVGNALNISESGFVTFDGVSIFKGRTLIAGTGISITNPDGVAGDPTISASATSNNFVIFTQESALIDFTQVADTLIYTPPSNFYLQSVVVHVGTITNLTIPGNANVGTNNPTYDNLFQNITSSYNGNNTFSTNTVTLSEIIVVPAGTPIYWSNNIGATATVANGRVFLTGVLL
jgi:hypothetical protein